MSQEFWIKLCSCTERVPVETTPARLYILVANIQLALRHEDNTGSSAEIARDMANHLIEAICHYVPEARESLEQGWNSAYDVSQRYFDAEFHIS